MAQRNAKLRNVGITTHEPQDLPKSIEGKDFPRGIEHLDLKWFEDSLTIAAIAACKDEAALLRLQNDAMWLIELRRLKLLSQET